MGGKCLGLLGLRGNGGQVRESKRRLLATSQADRQQSMRACVCAVHVWTGSCSTEGCVHLYTFPWSFSHKETANHRGKKGPARQARAAPCRWAQLCTCGSRACCLLLTHRSTFLSVSAY